MTVQNRIRIINLIDKIERNRKFANEIHVTNISVLKSDNLKHKGTERLKEKHYEKG